MKIEDMPSDLQEAARLLIWSDSFKEIYVKLVGHQKKDTSELRKDFIEGTVARNMFIKLDAMDLVRLEGFVNSRLNICPYVPAWAPAPTTILTKVSTAVNLSTTFQENEMTPINNTLNSSVAVQSITYVFGVPEDQVSDAQIFERIASIELAMAELGKIKAKSSKISEKIASYKADIAALVAIVDAR